MWRRECHSEDQGEKDSFHVEDVSQRGAEQAETGVGSAECEEVRRGVEEADRRAADVEATPEADEQPDTGLSQDEATEEGRISKGLKAPRRVTHAEREEHDRTHIPYRCWCDVCVKARGRRMAHWSKNEFRQDVR